MEYDHSMYEVLGIAKFMIFLSKRLGDRDYQRVCELQTDYLDQLLELHLEQSGIQC